MCIDGFELVVVMLIWMLVWCGVVRVIHARAEVRVFEALTPENTDDFLADVSVAIDGIDFFTITPRRLLYRECKARGIPVLGAGPIGFGTSMINFSPQKKRRL